jgi:hypothetical protein
MIHQRAPRTVALAMLLLAGAAVCLRAQEPAPEAPTKSGKTARPDRAVVPADANDEPAADTHALGAVGKVLPIGEKNLNVKIPSFKDGIPSSTVRAESMTRVDTENMAMERMDIRMFGKTHKDDVRIQLVTALYHMPSQILSSEQRSRVSREDFDLQGDSMIFDTRTGQGKMVGNVRMVIFDTASLMSQKKDSGESGPASDKPTATDKNAAAPAGSEPPPASPPPSSPSPNEKK